MNSFLDKDIKYFKLFISFIFVFWLLYHLITISLSPLPNMDEIFFANISDQLNKFNSLTLQLSSLPGEKSVPILHYGPIYFYLQSFFISNFGLNIVSVRCLSFVSGVIILLGLTYYFFKKIKYPFLVLLFFCVCATDMKFNAGLHSGRMDLLTILFFYSSIYFFVFYKNYFISIFSGILLAAAFLTSPRVVFYFPIFFMLF
jgi:4-amino-4-deoxy-L-arabinose transferase-like glycosyltransferase